MYLDIAETDSEGVLIDLAHRLDWRSTVSTCLAKVLTPSVSSESATIASSRLMTRRRSGPHVLPYLQHRGDGELHVKRKVR